MKILLIKPLSSKFFNAAVPPLGLMYLSAFLKRAGYKNIKLIHMDAARVTMKQLETEIGSYYPDIIGLSSIVSEAKCMQEIAFLAKQLLPNSLIVTGGPYPTAYLDDCLSNPAIDLIVKEEGEYTFLEIVKNYEKKLSLTKIEGICFKKNGKVIHNPDRPFIENLDELPYPDWDAIEIENYKNFQSQSPLLYKEKYMNIATSRGCPYNCTFCHHILGKKFRAHSAERVFSEISALYHKYNIRNFEISDDIFNFDRKRTMDIMNRIMASGLHIEMHFSNGIRGDILDEEIIDLFSKAGVVYMSVGIETGDSHMQQKIKKYTNLSILKSRIAYIAKKRIFVNGFFILGFPGETLREMFITICFAYKLKLHTAAFFVLHAHRGTELGDALGDEQVVNAENALSGYSMSTDFVNCSSLRKGTLILIRQLANIIFFFNAITIYRIFRDLPNKKALKLLVSKLIKRTVILK